MTATTIRKPSHADTLRNLQASLKTLNAVNEAYFAVACAGDLSRSDCGGMTCLREAEDFIQQAAGFIAKGEGFASPNVVNHFRWAIMKLAEFNMSLPDELQGDLDFDCFRKKAKRRHGRPVQSGENFAGADAEDGATLVPRTEAKEAE